MIEHVAIVGGGFSGALQAINLLRHDGPRATLIERDGPAGQGLAFGAAHPDHLLNVRAGNMGAFADDPSHFVRWLERQPGSHGAASFAPRLLYGRYLRELLAEAAARAGDRLRIVQDGVVDLVSRADGVRLMLDGGSSIDADAAVLAVGNLPPHDPAGLDAATLSHDRYRADPWEPGLAEGLDADDTVLILGTGLTMVDVALSLEAAGFAGRMLALSRRGLVPHVHAAVTPPPPRTDRPPVSASALVRQVRADAAEIGWRAAVDALRPATQMMWRAADDDQRGRFLRHLRPWWDVHRHRLAPPVAARIAALRERGRLTIRVGRTIGFDPAGRGVAVTWRPRGAAAAETMTVRRIVNCTGPQGDLERTGDRLLTALRARGAIRPDAQHLGIDLDPQCRVIAADGRADERLFAIGPMTRGAFWEIVAVPDIRVQTWTLARRFSHAQWVGGEGL